MPAVFIFVTRKLDAIESSVGSCDVGWQQKRKTMSYAVVIFDINNPRPSEESDIFLCKQAIYLMGDPEDLMSFSKFKMSVPDLRGREGRTPGPNSLNFMQFLGKFGEIVCWHPHPRRVGPPQGNPGSATEFVHSFCHAE